MAARRVRQIPRLVVGAIVVAIALFGIGLLVGGTLGSSHTTELRTVTTIVIRESPAQAARLRTARTTIATQSRRIAAENTAVVTLGSRLEVTGRRLAVTRRRLTMARRRLARARAALRADRRRLRALQRKPKR